MVSIVSLAIKLFPLKICVNGFKFLLFTIDVCSVLQCSNYHSYEFCRAVKKLQSQSESSLLSSVRSGRGEKILEVDGTVTTQPVLEHVGTSTWPGMSLYVLTTGRKYVDNR